MCKFILRTFKSRDKELLMTLFNSMVRRDELSFERLRHLGLYYILNQEAQRTIHYRPDLDSGKSGNDTTSS